MIMHKPQGTCTCMHIIIMSLINELVDSRDAITCVHVGGEALLVQKSTSPKRKTSDFSLHAVSALRGTSELLCYSAVSPIPSGPRTRWLARP